MLDARLNIYGRPERVFAAKGKNQRVLATGGHCTEMPGERQYPPIVCIVLLRMLITAGCDAVLITSVDITEFNCRGN